MYILKVCKWIKKFKHDLSLDHDNWGVEIYWPCDSNMAIELLFDAIKKTYNETIQYKST
jgi:hypothetical protein